MQVQTSKPAPPVDQTDASTDPWHALTAEAAAARLGVGLEGLSSAEAAERLTRYGPNDLPVQAARPAIVRLLAQFNNVLIYFLIAAAAAGLLLGIRLMRALSLPSCLPMPSSVSCRRARRSRRFPPSGS